MNHRKDCTVYNKAMNIVMVQNKGQHARPVEKMMKQKHGEEGPAPPADTDTRIYVHSSHGAQVTGTDLRTVDLRELHRR